MNCDICNTELAFRWTDTHGIGCCGSCGEPYRILHYEGEGAECRRVEKEPESLTRKEWVPLVREYYFQSRRMVPHGFDIPASGRTYSGLTKEDYDSFNSWCEANKDRLPKPADTTS